MKYFYSHLIEVESIVSELDKMELNDQERMHLAALLDSSLHHTILDAILSELSDQDKQIFLKQMKEKNQDEIWKFLNEKIDNIEDKIKKAAEDLKADLHEDLKKSKEAK